MQDLILDPAIRNYVLGPLTIIMLLSGLIRHYVTILLQSPSKPLPLFEISNARKILRGQIWRKCAHFVDPKGAGDLKRYLREVVYDSSSNASSNMTGEKEKGKEEEEAGALPPNPLDAAGMEGMMGMIKMQAVQFLPQTILMYYIGYFFDGFVLTKLPFPLTSKFKEMLQRGIQTPNMDVRWVSSISWYFLCLFGLNSVYRLILGGDGNAADNARDASQMNPMMGMGLSSTPGPTGLPGQVKTDYKKLFLVEKENLDLVEYNWVCEGVEERLLERFGK